MWKRVVPFAAWLWASNLLYNMFEVSDRYMLIHWSNSTAELAQSSVGQYHSGRVLPLLLVGVAAMLGGLLLPYMSEQWEAGKKDKAARQLNWSVKLVAIIFTIGSAALILLAPILFDGIWQGRYNDGLAILPLTLVYCIWFSLHTIGQNYLWVAEKGKWATLATGIGLVVNLSLNVALIPIIGLHGAVLATAVGNLLIVLVLFSLNHRFGCTTDRGIWLGAFLPMILLLDKLPMVVAAIVIAAICLTTNLIFDTTEKADILSAVKSKLSRS